MFDRPDQVPPFISHADAPYRGRAMLASVVFCAGFYAGLIWWLA
jgi:hypothetical protein